MTFTSPKSPMPAASVRLLTRSQVIAMLQHEVKQGSLTETAKKYEISPQQLSDIIKGRAGLSKRVLDKLRLRAHEFYERSVVQPAVNAVEDEDDE